MAIDKTVGGFGYVWEGVKLVLKPRLLPFVIIPFLINIVVFTGLVWLGIDQFEVFMNWMLPEEGWLSYLRWLLWPLFSIAAVLIVFYSFTAVANLIASPFNALLAEKVEVYLTGQQPSDTTPLLQSIVPSILSELRKLGYFLVRVIPLLIISFIPGINLIAPVLWALFNAWFLALEYGDFPMGNHGILFTDQHKRLKSNRLLSMAFGGGITLLMMVPLLNFLAMPAAVAGATAMWCKSLNRE